MKKIFAVVLVVAIALLGATAVFAAPHSDANTGGCNTCHTPHGATTTISAPLWGGSTAAAGSFGSATISVTDSSSLVCLFCHNGTWTTAGYAAMPGNFAVGADMSDDHPIGTGIIPGGNSKSHAPTVSTNIVLGNGNTTVECRTCHFVHSGVKMISGTQYQRSFAGTGLAAEAASFCSNCHSY